MSHVVKILRLVVASPSDVLSERDSIASAVQELNRSMCADRGLRVEVLRWETDSYPGFHADGPQGLIDPILRIEDCDILVGIFWKRFGTPTKDSASGTVHEFTLAYESWKKNGRPQVMVYFNQKPYAPQSREETDQWGQVLEFRRTFPKEGLWWPYKGTARFGNLFRNHVINFIRDTFPVVSSTDTGQPVLVSRPQAANYFAVQTRTIDAHARNFVGRARTEAALREFVENHKRGYFIVQGGPGQGKTAFSSHMVKEAGYVHHFISRTGGRSDSRLILRSLISQLLPPTNAQTIPETLSDLAKTFEELLSKAASSQRRVVIVIDGLDELPEEIHELPAYLIGEALPDGVFFLVTSRPGKRLEGLREYLFAVPHLVYELEPLEFFDVRHILQSRSLDLSTPEIERVAEASQGNPLYLGAVIEHLSTDRAYNLQTLPPSIEGFFRNATASLDRGNVVLEEVLCLLSIVRTTLSVGQLSKIAKRQQRDILERGIRPIRQFLLELDHAYTFYHSSFHEFVTQRLVFEDELAKSHQQIVDWLQLPVNETAEYRFSSLAYHLYGSGNCAGLIQLIDEGFLAEKARRMGYAVLEDIEYWTRALLQTNDPSLVERCVSLVEKLATLVGSEIVSAATQTVKQYRSGPESFRTRTIEQSVQSVCGLDVYVGILPKIEVAADFVEVIPFEDSLIVAIGDVPSVGLRSAFAARFIGNLFHKLVDKSRSRELDKILAALNSLVVGHDYFVRISLQCASIDPKHGLVRIANAGHPYPVHYSKRSRKCDILPLRGVLLADPFVSSDTTQFEENSLTFASGDVLVLVTDGLTEDHVIRGDSFGYRFIDVIRSNAENTARGIGEAILDKWKAYPREEDAGDDVSVVVVKRLET